MQNLRICIRSAVWILACVALELVLNVYLIGQVYVPKSHLFCFIAHIVLTTVVLYLTA